jgi:hypothetical protein
MLSLSSATSSLSSASFGGAGTCTRGGLTLGTAGARDER